MCIVIDVNRIPSVFNPDTSDHHEFRPILDWIESRNTMVVYGGKKYKSELSKMPRYLPILSEMRKAGLAYEADEASVDLVEQEICEKTYHTDFNDQAIIAIVIVSRCRLICSNNERHFPFFKECSLYPRHFKRPRIYTGRRNIDLLNDKHILGKCGPCC